MHLTAITLAGLFTSRVASSTQDGLFRPNTCGYWPKPLLDAQDNGSSYLDDYIAFSTYHRAVMQRSYVYEASCYAGDPSGVDCQYTVPFINSNANQNYSCPLPNSECWFDDYNLQIDTGYINSNLNLGINTRDDESVSYRKVTTCAPFDALPWESDWHTGPANILPGDTGLYLYLGPEIGSEDMIGDEAATVYVSNYSTYFPTQAYVLSWAESVLDDRSRSFFTLNTTFLNQTEEDVLVIFLLNYAQYQDPINDTWFYANTTWNHTGAFAGTYYISSLFPSLMFCSEQHQFFNPNLQSIGTGCTPLTGRTVTRNNLEADQGQSIGLTRLQWATAYRLSQDLDQFTISAVLNYLGAASMLAQQGLGTLDYNQEFLSEDLNDNQWQYEIMNWHNITLANMQRRAIDYVSGPEDDFSRPYIVPPTTPEGRDMCFNQRLRFSTAMSFSGLGILIFLCLGSFIIVTDLCLPIVVAFVQRHLQKGTSRRVAWIMDEMWQLQRMAYEGAGQALWRHDERMVPLTHKGDTFGPPTLAQHGVRMEYQYVHLQPKP